MSVAVFNRSGRNPDQVVLDPSVRLEYRTGQPARIAIGTAAELLQDRERLNNREGESLHVWHEGDFRRIVSAQDHTDLWPITGYLLVFATLRRLAEGREVTVEVAR